MWKTYVSAYYGGTVSPVSILFTIYIIFNQLYLAASLLSVSASVHGNPEKIMEAITFTKCVSLRHFWCNLYKV